MADFPRAAVRAGAYAISLDDSRADSRSQRHHEHVRDARSRSDPLLAERGGVRVVEGRDAGGREDVGELFDKSVDVDARVGYHPDAALIVNGSGDRAADGCDAYGIDARREGLRDGARERLLTSSLRKIGGREGGACQDAARFVERAELDGRAADVDAEEHPAAVREMIRHEDIVARVIPTCLAGKAVSASRVAPSAE